MQKRGKQQSIVVVQKPPNPNIIVNHKNVYVVQSVIHLRHLMTNNTYDFNLFKYIGDFNRQCNMFLADFKYLYSHIRNVLFQRYYTSFYGRQIVPLFHKCINELYEAWRIAIRRVWRIPWQTHCKLFSLIAGIMDPEFWFAKRSINFRNMTFNSSSQNVKSIRNI